MSMRRLAYQDARPRMKPGDVIAFGGKSHFSDLIKFATMSAVSHVGVILQTKAVEDDEEDRFFNLIIESTSLDDFSGVTTSRLSDRVRNYDGEVWWLPLNEELRDSKFNAKKFFDFLFRQDRKPYDLPQAIKSAIDVGDNLPFGLHGPGYNREDFDRFFYSELVAAGLEAGGVVQDVNASEVTPIDLCRWRIYARHYYQLAGDTSKEISRYNTLKPSKWAEAAA